MRNSADHILHALKDGIRNVRYTIRAEVETPGAALPKSVASIDLAPFIAMGAMVGKPALKAVDGILTQVESLATEVVKPHMRSTTEPATLEALFAENMSFSGLFFDSYKRLLAAHGARNVLLSEHALDQAQAQFRARHGDDGRKTIARTCAGLTLALAEARPIRKLDAQYALAGTPNLMLAPNNYCAAVLGLMTALVSRDASLRSDLDAVQDSVESVVDARFDRFKRAMSGKAPLPDLAAQFEALLPFLP